MKPRIRIGGSAAILSAVAEGTKLPTAFLAFARELPLWKRQQALAYLAELKRVIGASGSQRTTMETLVRRVGVNVRHANRRFTERFGTSMKTYLVRIRTLQVVEALAAGLELDRAAAAGYRGRKDVYRVLKNVLNHVGGD